MPFCAPRPITSTPTSASTAMRQGKHVYCEKPLTHNVWEARLVARVAKETGVATQLGNQGHSGDFIRHDLRNDLGRCDRGRARSARLDQRQPLEQSHSWRTAAGRTGAQGRQLGPVAGTACQPRPYSSAYNPVTWRDFWDFGTAPIGDFFCHNFDPACWALDLREPLSIEAYAVGGVDSLHRAAGRPLHLPFRPARQDAAGQIHLVRGRADARAAGGTGAGRPTRRRRQRHPVRRRQRACSPVPAGRARHPAARRQGRRHTNARPRPCRASKAITAIGSTPAKAARRPAPISNTAPRSPKSACSAWSPCALGKKIYWDAKAMKATNAPAADKFLKETYRPGWELT